MIKKLAILYVSLGALILILGSHFGDGYPLQSNRLVLLDTLVYDNQVIQAKGLYDSTSGAQVNLYKIIVPCDVDGFGAEIIYPNRLSSYGYSDTVLVEVRSSASLLRNIRKIKFQRYNIAFEVSLGDKNLVYARDADGNPVKVPADIYKRVKETAQKNWGIYQRAFGLWKNKKAKAKAKADKEFFKKYFPRG